MASMPCIRLFDAWPPIWLLRKSAHGKGREEGESSLFICFCTATTTEVVSLFASAQRRRLKDRSYALFGLKHRLDNVVFVQREGSERERETHCCGIPSSMRTSGWRYGGTR
ncbi:unnamed protein product [Phaeothamnion confervicola]